MGQNVNYNCSANSTRDVSNDIIELNTDLAMHLMGKDGKEELLDFSEINFNGIAKEESSNIQSNIEYFSGETATLINTVASLNDKHLLFTGTLEQSSDSYRRLSLADGEDITMILNPDANDLNLTQKYICNLNEISKPTFTLDCNTSNTRINTNSKTLHLSSGKSTDGTLFTVQMQNPNETVPISAESENSVKYFYVKSSKSLSGGAIAGIVIAVVVAIAAAILAAFKFSKLCHTENSSSSIINLKNTTL